MSDPLVSVLVANLNGATYLEAAVTSALRQTHAALEVVVADDGSTDASEAIVRRLAAHDPRVRWLAGPARTGPAAARNRALAAARGEWIAILDADDLFHPDRLRQLLAAARAHAADMVADDLLLFADDPAERPRRFLRPPEARSPFAVTPALYARQTALFGRKPNLGFLKPMIRAAAWREAGVRYDERLRIAEDDDLVLRLLAAGLRYHVAPSLTYFYRKHPGSTSHRLTVADLTAQMEAARRRDGWVAGRDRAVVRAMAARQRALAAAAAFQRAVEALKARRPVAAAAALAGCPRAALLFRMPLAAAWRRIAGRPASRSTGNGRDVLFVSRQRLVDARNGSSAYLLALARAVRAAGYVPHLIQPSPTIVGRRPVLRFGRELAVFASHRVRGVWRIGPFAVSREPRVWRAALAGMLARHVPVLARLGDTPFPHSIALPWTDADRLFVAAQGRAHGDAVLCDYVFQAEALPFLLRPASPSAIVMHDLFATRRDGFAAQDAADSIVLAPAAEAALLARADAAIAIQRDEADWVRRAVPGPAVIVVPMAAAPVAAPQPGRDGEALFVASNAPPNVAAVRWLLGEVWPRVREALPAARLRIAGSVADAFPDGGGAGAVFLGTVGDLAPLYADAGVVISPLTLGSGLKIKLVEALAHGKAIVATSVTLQGVEAEAGDAVARADTAAAFAAALAALMTDRAARGRLGERALAAARAHFAEASCYRPLLAWLDAQIERAP